MEISYSTISSNHQTSNTNDTQNQEIQKQNVQVQTKDLEGLRTGKIFRGEILDIKGAQVTIGLENGQELHAKLVDGMQLSVGQTLSFEVESNTGTKLVIKPADASVNLNPVLQKALQEANIAITDKNLLMVTLMMKEGLSINKQSLSSMLKQINANQNVDIGVLIKMNQLGIETTKENIQQFENYKNYEHRMVKDINHAANHFSQVIKEIALESKDSLKQVQLKLLSINGNLEKEQEASLQAKLAEQANRAADAKQSPLNGTDLLRYDEVEGTKDSNPLKVIADRLPTSEIVPIAKEIMALNETAGQDLGKETQVMQTAARMEAASVLPQEAIQLQSSQQLLNGSIENATQLELKEAIVKPDSQLQVSKQLADILTIEERENLSEALKELGVSKDLQASIKQGSIGNKDLFQIIRTLVETPELMQKADVLFQSKEYSKLLGEVWKEAWLVSPKDLEQPDKIAKFYKQLDEQTRQLSTLFEGIGKQGTPFMKDIANIRSNLNFMEQINQNVTYCQIPIQFTNEEAHSDLYVYTNKKNLKEKEGDLSVLLHLDMEMLGSTDVYINLSKNQVSTKFSMQDKQAMELIAKHMDSLVKRLEEKGYQVSTKVEAKDKEQDFVEDFLDKDKVSTSLKRYAFDVRM